MAIRLFAQRATQGFVVGVDPSDVMLWQVTQRNQATVAAGRVELRLGSVEALPYPDAAFDKALALHSVCFWPSLQQGRGEITRVLVPDGVLMLGVRMKRFGVGHLNPSRYGLSDDDVAEIVATLSALVSCAEFRTDLARSLERSGTRREEHDDDWSWCAQGIQASAATSRRGQSAQLCLRARRIL